MDTDGIEGRIRRLMVRHGSCGPSAEGNLDRVRSGAGPQHKFRTWRGRGCPMRKAIWIVSALGFCLAVTAASAGDGREDDAKQLQGAWRLESVEVGGKVTPADAAITLTISGDKVSLRLGGRTLAGTLRLDPAAKPQALDLRYEGDPDPTLAVYEVTGNTLRICEARPGGKRPTELSSKAGSGGMVSVYKRVKP
jgi:uncharacterized protein (TIGR03067 family)